MSQSLKDQGKSRTLLPRSNMIWRLSSRNPLKIRASLGLADHAADAQKRASQSLKDQGKSRTPKGEVP